MTDRIDPMNDKPAAGADGAASYALTDQHIKALETAIRAEGYTIMIDLEDR